MIIYSTLYHNYVISYNQAIGQFTCQVKCYVHSVHIILLIWDSNQNTNKEYGYANNEIGIVLAVYYNSPLCKEKYSMNKLHKEY